MIKKLKHQTTLQKNAVKELNQQIQDYFRGAKVWADKTYSNILPKSLPSYKPEWSQQSMQREIQKIKQKNNLINHNAKAHIQLKLILETLKLKNLKEYQINKCQLQKKNQLI